MPVTHNWPTYTYPHFYSSHGSGGTFGVGAAGSNQFTASGSTLTVLNGTGSISLNAQDLINNGDGTHVREEK